MEEKQLMAGAELERYSHSQLRRTGFVNRLPEPCDNVKECCERPSTNIEGYRAPPNEYKPLHVVADQPSGIGCQLHLSKVELNILTAMLQRIGGPGSNLSISLRSVLKIMGKKS